MIRKHRLPKTIARLTGLAGGQYGMLQLIARRVDLLELELGNDFLELSREQAGTLRDALQRFLDLALPCDEGAALSDDSMAAVLIVTEETGEPFVRPGRRRASRPTSE